MWRIPISCVLLSVLAAKTAPAQEIRRPYGPFDAIADGARSNELRQLSMIDTQSAQNDRLRSLTVPVAGPRIFARDPGVVAVHPYGRSGILGLRPQGYVVVRRAPVVVYRRTYVTAPPAPPTPYEPHGAYGSAPRELTRHPIGHESMQTGPNRWEYRPLYANDDRRLDDVHRDIERNLRPGDEVADQARSGVARDSGRRAAARISATEPEELPTPDEVDRPARRVAPRQAANRGIARDIARDDRREVDDRRREVQAPPQPQPDPPEQPAHSPAREPRSSDRAQDGKEPPVDDPADDEVRGPLLQDPKTGTREF